jgi:hypothetical protein
VYAKFSAPHVKYENKVKFIDTNYFAFKDIINNKCNSANDKLEIYIDINDEKKMQPDWDSNQGHSEYHTSALPYEPRTLRVPLIYFVSRLGIISIQ